MCSCNSVITAEKGVYGMYCIFIFICVSLRSEKRKLEVLGILERPKSQRPKRFEVSAASSASHRLYFTQMIHKSSSSSYFMWVEGAVVQFIACFRAVFNHSGTIVSSYWGWIRGVNLLQHTSSLSHRSDTFKSSDGSVTFNLDDDLFRQELSDTLSSAQLPLSWRKQDPVTPEEILRDSIFVQAGQSNLHKKNHELINIFFLWMCFIFKALSGSFIK